MTRTVSETSMPIAHKIYILFEIEVRQSLAHRLSLVIPDYEIIGQYSSTAFHPIAEVLKEGENVTHEADNWVTFEVKRRSSSAINTKAMSAQVLHKALNDHHLVRCACIDGANFEEFLLMSD